MQVGCKKQTLPVLLRSLTGFGMGSILKADMQLSGNKLGGRKRRNQAAATVVELKEGESGILDRLDLPEDVARRLMELGFLPGQEIVPAHSAPGGDPRVFRIDGSEVALRRETAARLYLRRSECTR